MGKLWTIAELKARFDKKVRANGKQVCPVCSHKAEILPRSISGKSMARVLVLWSQEWGSEWAHVKRALIAIGLKTEAEGGSFAKLHHWGLIERDNDRRGWWRVTPKGLRYARGEIKIWRTAMTLNIGDKLIGFVREDGKGDIREALGKKFDLDQLLKGR